MRKLYLYLHIYTYVVAVWSLSLVWLFVTPGHLCPWDFPGKNTGVDCHFLLQGIFPTQGWNVNLRIGRLFLYHWATGEAPIYNYIIYIYLSIYTLLEEVCQFCDSDLDLNEHV